MPTYAETVRYHAEQARTKRQMMFENPIGFLILCIFAGVYVGMAVILIFSIGQHLDAPLRPLVMGATFGLALVLVVFAGAELFTGHTMYYAHGLLVGTTSAENLVQSWVTTWVGNLVGAIVLSAIFVAAGGGHVLAAEGESLLQQIAAKKATTAPLKLVLLGMLCNWLVCLALWSASRTKNDAAKLGIICFCLLGFIGSGYEHVIANMTIFAIALMSETSSAVTLNGAGYNLLWVTLGNTFAGAGVMGLGYWIAAGRPEVRHQPVLETF